MNASDREPTSSPEWVHFEAFACWLEIVDGDRSQTVEVYQVFPSAEERYNHLKTRIDAGVMYDLLWWGERTNGADPALFPETEITEENGFVTGERRHVQSKDRKVLHRVGAEGRPEKESDSGEGEELHD